MGLFDKIFGNRPKPQGEYKGEFKLLNGYVPRFTSYNGELYESELVRSAINTRAVHMSKLKVETKGSAKPSLQVKLAHAPNQWQTWSQWLYRASTLLDIHNNLFIVPIWDEYGEISGIYTPLPQRCELVQYGDKPFLRYEFAWGEKASVELEYCGIMNKFQYKSDLLGESNRALLPTMDLVHMQNQGIQEGVKNAASYKFIAKLSNFAKPEDLARERKRYSLENFGRDAEGGGLLLFPNTYSDIKQIDMKPWVVDAEQMEIINKNVYEYFGVNEEVLQNKAYGDSWSAFYEGAVEPFAIQLSEVLTKMLFTFREQSNGNEVAVTSNRLQYLSNADKLNVSSQLLDRGIMSINDVREIWNLPPVEGGDTRIIRGEYYSTDEKIGEDNGQE
jgi:HK97 family phage portal protein